MCIRDSFHSGFLRNYGITQMESANDTPQRESSLLLPSQEFWSRRRPVEWQRPLPRQVRFARSQEEYQRLIHLWLATNKASATQIAERVRLKDPAIKIETVTLHYREFAAGYYVKNGKPTKELSPRQRVIAAPKRASPDYNRLQ